LFVGEDLNFGLMPGPCIIAMPLLMTHSPSGSFWPKIDIEIGPSTIFARFGPMRLLAIPKTEDRFEGPQIFRHCRQSGHVTTILKSIPEEEFQKCFEQWKHRLPKYIGVQGDYFEGDSNH
jgi:hypothetical protein